MAHRSLAWYAAISQCYCAPWDAEHPPQDATLPWLYHCLHKKLAALIERVGVTRTLAVNESVFAPGTPADQVVFVKKGVIGRKIGTYEFMDIIPPGRLACGNLNLLSGQAGMASYFALVPSDVVACPAALFRQLLLKDPELLALFCLQAELASLSDRLAFSICSILPVQDRIKAFFLSWAFCFGDLITINNHTWFVMPMTIQRNHIASATNTSRVSLDLVLRDWKKEGRYDCRNERVYLRADLLKPIYDWILTQEEPSLVHRHPDFMTTCQNISEARALRGITYC